MYETPPPISHQKAVAVSYTHLKKCDIEWAKNGQEMVELFQQHQMCIRDRPYSI